MDIDIFDKLENWQLAAAALLIIGLIGFAGYLAFGNNADTQTYTLEGDLVKFHEATDAVEAERLYMTDTGSCDSPVVGESNLSTNQVEMPFTVEDRVKEEGNYDSPFNHVSVCLRTNYGELTGSADTLRSLKERGGLIESQNMPDKISFVDSQGEHVFEIRNLEIKAPVE